MSDGFVEMGPIDYPAVGFPGNRMTGQGFPLLVDPVDRGLIRIPEPAAMDATDPDRHPMT